MFPIVVTQVPDVENEIEYIRSQQTGMELGRGCFASVYASGQSRVIRVTDRNDWGYLTYLEKIRSYGRMNPWFPVVHHVDVYMDCNDRMGMCVVLERLTRPWNEWGETDDSWKPYKKIMEEIETAADHPASTAQWIRDNRELTEALNVVQSAKRSSGHAVDLHFGNIMLRGSQLVLTDPLGYA